MRKHLTLLLGILFCLGLFSFGCVPKVKKEHLDRLAATEAQAKTSEALLGQVRAERIEWEGKLALKEKELETKKAERDDLAKQLGK